VEQVQILRIALQQLFLGQAGAIVLGREAGDVVGGFGRGAQRGRREIRRAGIAARLPIITVTPTTLSRFCSMVSTSPLRTDTDRPLPSEISVAASVAPSSRATRSTSAAMALSWSWV
jgi:hypothetical protein